MWFDRSAPRATQWSGPPFGRHVTKWCEVLGSFYSPVYLDSDQDGMPISLYNFAAGPSSLWLLLLSLYYLSSDWTIFQIICSVKRKAKIFFDILFLYSIPIDISNKGAS
jgi:hypothetical protein